MHMVNEHRTVCEAELTMLSNLPLEINTFFKNRKSNSNN